MFPPTHSLHVPFVRHSLAALSTSPPFTPAPTLRLSPRQPGTRRRRRRRRGGGEKVPTPLCVSLFHKPPSLSLSLCFPLDCASLSVCPFALAHFPSFPPTVSCPAPLLLPFSHPSSPCPPFISHVPHMHRWTYTRALPPRREPDPWNYLISRCTAVI